MTFRNTPDGRAALHVRYGELALAARSAAAAERLENVRQKHLTAALTWEHLANAGRGMDRLRERRAIEQAGRRVFPAAPAALAGPARCG